MKQMPEELPVKKNSARRTFSFMALFALVLGTIMMVPLRAGAANPATDMRLEWTATEAEVAREISEGVLLRDIINNTVRSGERIHKVVVACIKVGVDPSLVVYTAISEGYSAQTVVKAALKAGAPLNAVVNSAVNTGLDEKSTYVGNIVDAAIKAGEDPSLLVYTAITEGYSVQTVIRAALKAGAPLEAVVNAATNAGADKKSIYVGAADAGASPAAVERALSTAKTPGASVFISAPPTAAAPPSPAFASAPAIFGRGGIVLSQAPAWAAPTLPLGPLKLNPFLGLSETFSDNVLFTADNRKRDLITTITPGVRVELPFQAHSAELEYYSVIARYGHKYRDDDISDHHVNAAVDLNFGDRFGMRLSDQFARDHEPRSSSATGNLEVFHTNAASLSASYRPSDLTRIQIDYSKANWGYVTDHFRDHDEDLIAGTFFYQVLSRTSAFIEYGHRKFTYTVEAADFDSKEDTVQAGLTWDLSARTRGTIKAGLAHKDFTSSTRRDVTLIVWSADVRHDLTSDTTVVLTARRSPNEPNRPDIDYFISTGFYAELTHHFLKEWAAVFRGAQVTDAYSALKADRTFLGGAGLTYKAMDWIEFAVDYNWHQRNSSILGKYVEHSTGVTANISF